MMRNALGRLGLSKELETYRSSNLYHPLNFMRTPSTWQRPTTAKMRVLHL